MATKKKLLQAAAGNAGGEALNVEDVFSTYLYQGTSANQTITNDIDLDGEGGLVWVKGRPNAGYSHGLYDTERGVTKRLASNETSAESTYANSVTAFNNNGFSLGSDGNGEANYSGSTYVSWTFRKAKKFFDVVTYTGNGVAGRTVSHNLNSVAGCIIVKATNNARSWAVYHRGTDSTAPEDYGLYLNETTDRSDDAQLWNDTAPTSTEFTVGTDGDTNVSGRTYVAYLFAHNDGDGEFGPDGDADIIKCGSFTGTGNYQEIDLGFEAQWVMIKRTDSSQDWMIFDVMRGMPDQGGTGSIPSGNDARLKPNTSDAEQSDTYGIDPHANGFAVRGNNISVNGSTYIYIAIRRGPMAVPESATDVFATAFDAGATNPTYVSGFVADMGIQTNTGGYNKRVSSRLTSGRFLEADNTGAESTSSSNYTWDFMNGWNNQTINSTWLSWMWKRAPNYFDVVAYTGEGTKQTITHNLGVAPEMMWIKVRSTTQNWAVYHPDLPGSGKFISLNNNWDGNNTNSNFWDGETPTSTTFSVGATGVNNSYVNGSGNTYIAYLFASLAGISKVGSVTHSGTTNVDCGFSSGARFVLLKRTDATGDWYVWDSERGIVSGNDPYLLLNSTAAEVTNTDYIDPLSSGFTITSSFTAGDYIFYAIA